MSLKAVKTFDKVSNGFVEKHIFGLNIFTENKVDCSIETNPQLELLRQICSQNKIAINIGNLFDYSDTPNELFGNTKYSNNYNTVRIGCYNSEFYDFEDWDTFPPLLFSDVNSDFFNIIDNDKSLIMKILYLDAIAVFLSPKQNNSDKDLLKLMNEPLTSIENFLIGVLNIYGLLMISQSDGDYYTFITNNSENFEILNSPLKNSERLIEDSTWYQENKHALVWDDNYSMCLKIDRPLDI